MVTGVLHSILTQARSGRAALLPAIVAILLGLFIVFFTGFANIEAVHNAAHDNRHSFAFPCH